MITIRDEASLEEKLSGFTPDNVRLVTDFDETITRWTGDNSWSVFKSALWPDYTETAERLFGIFSWFETDTHHERLKRERMIKRWWRHHLSLMQKTPLTEAHLNKDLIVPLVMRQGMREMLARFSELHIPILVFSGGIAQVIEMILERELGRGHTAHVVANRLSFGSDGISTGIAHEPIHSLNKTELHQAPFPQNIAERTHTIIFGDSLSDRDMVSPQNPVISVGLLSARKANQKGAFEQKFDVVVKSEVCDGGIWERLLARIGIR